MQRDGALVVSAECDRDEARALHDVLGGVDGGVDWSWEVDRADGLADGHTGAVGSLRSRAGSADTDASYCRR